MRRMRKVVVFLAAWASACGGEVTSPSPDGTEMPVPSEATPPTPDTPVAPPREPVAPAGPVDTTASRDGAPLYLSMCHTEMKPGVETIWGQVEDHTFEVDEGIISFALALPSSVGAKACASDLSAGVVVGFAEGRGAEFTAEPSACTFELTADGSTDGVVRGSVDAEYVGLHGKRHHFQVDFAAAPCMKE